MKRNWGGAYESVAVLVAVGADPGERCEAVGVEEGHGESEDSWRDSLGEAAPPSLCHSALEAFQAVRSCPATDSATNNPELSVFKRCEASLLKTLLNLSDLRIFCLL